MSVSIYLSDYRDHLFWFRDDRHRKTIMKAMQPRDVLNYIEHPEEHDPPASLVRVFLKSRHDDREVAERLIFEQNMIAKTDEERAMLDSFNLRKKDILECGNFFWRILHMDLSKSHTVPYIFYPMLRKTSTPSQMVDQLLGLMSSLPCPSQHLFFALLFKFSARNKKTVPSERFPVLQWKPSRRVKEDPLCPVYLQASRALWDYYDHIRHGNGNRMRSMKAQHLDWIAWMRERQCYQLFLDTCIDGPRSKKFHRQVSIFTHFIWRYIVKNERSLY